MPYRKQQFVDGEIYHIVTRAIDDNLIFKDINDYYRGIFCIYEMNNALPVVIQKKREARARFKKESRQRESTFIDEREKFVEILAFCFMPNHIHLLLRQIKNDGISKFMKKVGIGYAKYFNTKYDRKGYVFQNRFKPIHIENDKQFLTVVPYIFTNPISLVEPGWKENGMKNHSTEEILQFLKEYKWSNYQDCIGIKNFPSVTKWESLLEIIGGEKSCIDLIKNRIEYKTKGAKEFELSLE